MPSHGWGLYFPSMCFLLIAIILNSILQSMYSLLLSHFLRFIIPQICHWWRQPQIPVVCSQEKISVKKDRSGANINQGWILSFRSFSTFSERKKCHLLRNETKLSQWRWDMYLSTAHVQCLLNICYMLGIFLDPKGYKNELNINSS